MERIELIKEIEGLDIVNLLQISVDDKIGYVRKEYGMNVLGCFDINAIYTTTKNESKNICDSINVDMTIPYENIINSDQFKVYVEDFNYQLIGNSLLLKVYINFASYKDVDTTFPTSSYMEMKDSEPFIYIEEEKMVSSDSIVVENNNNDEAPIPFLERYFNRDKYKKTASFHVLKDSESIEDVSMIHDVSLDELRSINRSDTYQKGDLINIPVND